jgi:hypothetical protein
MRTSTMTTRLLRPSAVYGPNGLLPVGRTKFYVDYILREGGPKFITGTQVPRLHIVPLGPRAVAFDHDEVEDRLERLKRDRSRASQQR